jgi:radical SAM protein
MDHSTYSEADFPLGPLMFYYEVTRACDLVCKHCRASAQETPNPDQLTLEQGEALLSQIAMFPRKPTVVLTGGDPLKRPDLLGLIRHGISLGIQLALTPSATPLATREAFEKVRDAGIRRLGISLDGPDAATHDAFRGWAGSFERTLKMLASARDLGMQVQVNTSLCARNMHLLDSIAQLLVEYKIAMWAVFFLVPVGRGVLEPRISPQQYEEVFEKLFHYSQTMPYAVKTTEAPHYRRYVLQHGGNPLAGPGGATDGHHRGHRAPLGITDGKGIMFVSNTGEILPAGFLPLTCGRFPQDSVIDVYQKHPIFLALRKPNEFKGKCGVCEFRNVCGGSRSRAFGLTGDPLESEPDCAYEPKAMRVAQAV